jgi:hypothetical protein
MHRFAAGLCALACALALPNTAFAAHRLSSTPAGIVHGTASGTVIAVSGTTVTIQTAGRRTGVINALIAAANSVTKGDYPYVWGGGHAVAGVASVGIRGPGYTGHRRGLDCSGAVAAVLSGGGLWPAGGSVPNDAGVIAQLRSEGLLARGPGKAPSEVTLYDDPGVHIFMNIDGRFFGTSDGGAGNPSQRRGGAGWLNDTAWDATSRAYHQWHVLTPVLHDRTTYGHEYTFVLDPSIPAFQSVAVGDAIRVSYAETPAGSLSASDVTYRGARTTTGTVQTIAGSTVTIQTAAGATQTVTVPAGVAAALAGSLAVGDTIQVTYTSAHGVLTARLITVTATPAPTVPTTPTPTTTTTPTPTGTGPGYGYPGGGNGDGGNQGGGYPSAR